MEYEVTNGILNIRAMHEMCEAILRLDEANGDQGITVELPSGHIAEAMGAVALLGDQAGIRIGLCPAIDTTSKPEGSNTPSPYALRGRYTPPVPPDKDIK